MKQAKIEGRVGFQEIQSDPCFQCWGEDSLAMIFKSMTFSLVFVAAIAVSSCALDEWSGDNVSCVVGGLRGFGDPDRSDSVPNYSGATAFDREQVRGIVDSMSLEQREALKALADVAFRNGFDSADEAVYIKAHEEIFNSFLKNSHKYFSVSKCGDREAVGQQAYIIFGDWVMVPYRNGAVFGYSDFDSRYRFSAVDLIRTAVILEVEGVAYDFSRLSSAMGYRKKRLN